MHLFVKVVVIVNLISTLIWIRPVLWREENQTHRFSIETELQENTSQTKCLLIKMWL